MKWVFKYLKPLSGRIAAGITVKTIGTLAELMIPFLLSYILEHVIKTNDIKSIVDNSYFRGEVPQDALYIVLGGDAGQNQSHWLASAICADGSIKVIDWGTLQSYTSANGHYGYKH